MRYMRKFLAMAATLAAVMFTTTSCLVNDNDVVQQNWRLISIIDGDATTGIYGIFDDGSTVCIENNEEFIIPSEYFHKGEARAMINYEVSTVKQPGYDHTVKVKALECIRTLDIYNGLDEDVVADYIEGIRIHEATFARNYITLNLHYRSSANDDRIKAHDFILVYNPTQQGPHQDAYQRDGFLYLELYHDTNNDVEQYDNLVKRCYLFDANLLGIDMLSCRGIKIIYKSLVDGNSKVVTLTEFK